MNVFPSRLKEARESKGLNMTDLANLVGVTRQAVSSFERGVDTPSLETLMRMCQVLGVPREFFTNDSRDEPGIEGPIFFRSRKTTAKKDRAISQVKSKWVARTFTQLGKFLDLPSVRLPDLCIGDCESLTDEEIEEAATHTRRFFGIGNGPISDVTTLLENHGIVVVEMDAAKKIGAFSFSTENGQTFVVTASSGSVARKRFSLAHELGHLVLHRTLADDFMEDKELFDLIESQADKFASAFLLPKETFSQEFFSPKLRALVELKRRWRVSIAAITMRAFSLNLINDNQKVYIFKQLAPYRKVEPLDLELVGERPSYLKKALQILEENSIFTKQDLRDAVQLPIADLAQFFGLSVDDFYVEDRKVVNFKLKAI